MKTVFFGVLMILAGAGCDEATDHAPSSTVISEIATSYRKMQLATTQPVEVDPDLPMLCISVSASTESAKRVSGPHAHTTIRVFMNQPATDAFKTSAKAYPVGAIIVKEKTGRTYNTVNPETTHDGVGGMVKRPPGYDPEHGDWEYFYFEDPAKIESGKIASCVACHAGAGQDHVFGSWAKNNSKD